MPPRKPSARSTRAKLEKSAPMPTIEIEDLSSFEESVNILVHGDSGVGKTVLGGGAPRAVFISPEKGAISAKRFGSGAKLIRTPTWRKFAAAVQHIEDNIDDFDWVIVDSLPKMQAIMMRHLLDLEADINESRDPDVPEIQDHQKLQNMFLRYVAKLVDLPVNCIFLSTSMRIETEDENGDPEDILLPAIQGKAKQGYAVAQQTCAEMDAVWYLRRVKNKQGKLVRQIVVEKIPGIFAKDRFNAFGKPVVTIPDNDPSLMERLLQKIAESGDKATPKAPREPADFDEPELDDTDEDDDEEEEDQPEPPKRPSRSRKAAKPTETEEEEEDDEEDEPEPPKRSRTTSARRKPAPKPEPEEDDEDDEEEEPPAKPARRTAPNRRAAKTKAKSEPEEDDEDPWGDDEADDDSF